MSPLMRTDSRSFLKPNDLQKGIVENPNLMERDPVTDRELKSQVKWCKFFLYITDTSSKSAESLRLEEEFSSRKS